MGWTDEEMREAELTHGLNNVNSDTYRLWLRSDVEGKPGKMLTVPGWMVGDPEIAALRLHAADIIRERLFQNTQKEKA